MTTFLYALVSVVLVSLISLVGVASLASNINRLNNYLLYIVSFSAGALLGDVFIHLLPEFVDEYGFNVEAGLSVLAGIVAFFVLEQFIHWHHHHSLECGINEPDCEHERVHVFAITNLVGDAFHNFLDGVVIAASYLLSIPAGIATTVAVFFHEIPQEIGDFGVLLHGGFTKRRAIFFNFLTATTAVIGVLVAYPIGERVTGIGEFLIPFTAGSFIYIAGVDLIPEIHKGRTGALSSFLKLLAFILGVFIMLLLK
ncbi:MAG: ZIP family metal transporter [bacterium]|nr:ZIP family metal transporter [bacterium]